jgi:hypothetical protein
LIRGGALLVLADALKADPDGYRQLAENLVTHGTFGMGEPTAYRPPLYPLLLTGCVAVGDHARAAIGVLHVVLGLATVALVWVLARWWGFGKLGAALAALLVALDPILLTQSAQVMTETLAAFLTTAGLVVLTWTSRRPTAYRALLAGATLALGVLCRPTLLLWTVLVAVTLWLQWAFRHGSGATAGLSSSTKDTVGQANRGTRHGMRQTPLACGTAALGCADRSVQPRETVPHLAPIAFLLGILILLSPWAIRNQLQFGRPIVTTTHGGYTLLLANNPEFYEWLGTGAWGSVWRADRFNVEWNGRKPHDELQADRLAYSEAWKTIRQAPGTFFYACMVRLGRFCSPLPHQIMADETPSRRRSRYLVALWYAMEFLLAAVGVWRLRRAERREERGKGRDDSAIRPSPAALTLFQRERGPTCWLWGLLLVASLLAAHAVYWTDMRMRGPAMPVIALAAAAGLCRREQHA